MEIKTPLYDCHVATGGRLMTFGGYILPLQYSGIIEEHMAVRQSAGIFDLSHMGEIIISGPDAQANINDLFTNDFSKMPLSRVRYSTMCNDLGGIIDDMVIYHLEKEKFMLVPNASNKQKVFDHIVERIKGDVQVTDISEDTALIALQGPKSYQILAKLTDVEKIPLKYYSFTDHVLLAGVDCLLSQTGYTGELGYEMYCSSAQGALLWNSLLEAGTEEGLLPCGLGARDTLRLEAGMPLYGHEMTAQISPLEARLEFSVKMSKESFIGKKALIAKGNPQVLRVGLKITGRGIAREHAEVFSGEDKIGEVTSGTHLPYLHGAYAMAYLKRDFINPGTQVEVDVRGKIIKAEVVPLPFYSRS